MAFVFLRQFIEYGLKDKMAVIGGMTALDDPVLRNLGDEARSSPWVPSRKVVS